MKNYPKLMNTRHCEHLRKMDSRSTKKLIALRVLRNKTCTLDKKSNSILSPQRKLRPRFPYSASDEWPVARAHRVASLNARAKVHILYENECRGNGNDSYESEEGCVSETGKLNDCDKRISHPTFRQMNKNVSFRDKEKQSLKGNEKVEEKTVKKPHLVRKKRIHKRKLDDVEIIDTRSCKRMANLNAQAILAASYLLERSRKERLEKRLTRSERKSDSSSLSVNNSDSISCDQSTESAIYSDDTNENIIVDDLDDAQITTLHHNISDSIPEKRHTPVISISDDQDENIQLVVDENEKFPKDDTNIGHTIQERCELHSMASDTDTSRTLTSTAVSKVGMTEYTEVTKVHINTTEDTDIKAEKGKVEQKIEHILEKDDVAITRMYHYQTKGNSQSYCLQMQTTYKPSATKEFSPPPSVIGQSSPRKVRLATPPHMMNAMLHNSQNYYNYPSHAPVIPEPNPQTYPIGHGLTAMNNVPMVNVGPLARHYSSAFTVPHYGHPPPMPYSPNEFGYYQPAGPLIQPIHDPCLIHKPVPYHPQHHHMHPSQNTHSSYPDQCLSHHSGPPSQHQNSHCSHDVHPPPASQPQPPPPPPPPHYPQENLGNNQYQIAHHQINQSASHPQSSSHHQPYSNHSLPVLNYHCPNQPSHPQNHIYPQCGTQYCQEYPPTNYRVSSSVKTQQKENNSRHSVPSISPLQTAIPKSEPVTPPDTKHHSENRVSNVYKNIPAPPITINSAKKKLETKVQETITKESRNSNILSLSDSSKNDNKDNIILVKEKQPEKCLQSPVSLYNKKEETVKTSPIQNNNEKQEEHYVINSVQRRARLLKLRHHLKQSLPAYPINVNVDYDKYEEQANISKPISDDNVFDSTKQCSLMTQKDDTNTESPEIEILSDTEIKCKDTVESTMPQKKLFVSIPRLVLPKKSDKQFSNGWSWVGEPFEKLVYYSNDDPPCMRKCYSSMKHVEGDTIKVKECVLLKSGPKKTDLPFVAKIVSLWENPDDGWKKYKKVRICKSKQKEI